MKWIAPKVRTSRTSKIFSWALFFFLVLATPVQPQDVLPSPQEAFPLKKGNYWTYQGVTKWAVPGVIQPREKEITWRMEVVNVIRRKDVTVAVLKGHPQDLVWYEEGITPQNYLIVRIDEKRYYLIENERIEEVLSRIKGPDDTQDDLVYKSELFLDLPLKQAKTFGETVPFPRSDDFYHWVVANEQYVQLDDVKGFVPKKTLTQYELIFRTLPDQTSVGFVSGVGITRYMYRHHGTVAEADLKLIEYFDG